MGIVKLLFEIMESIVSGIIECVFDFLNAAISKERKTELDASFMKEPGILINSTNRGFTVNGSKFLSIADSTKNQITYGGTGAGKTTNILIPQLLHSLGHGSMVVNDPSGEIAAIVAPVARDHMYRVKILNYVKFDISEQYNPLARIRTIADAQKVAKLFLAGFENKGSDPFWQISAGNILSICFRLLQYSPKEVRTVHNALRILEELSFSNKVDKLIVRTKDDALISSYKSFVANDKKLANSILATAKSALTLFQDESVIQVTADDTLDFASFRKEKTILFINNNIANTKHYASLTGILLNQAFNELMNELPTQSDLPIFFNIDESASVVYENLPIVIANCRKYAIGLGLFYQSYHQLCGQFSVSDAKSVEANCWTKIYLPGTPIDIAAKLQEELGVYEFETEEGVRRTRHLMTSSEIKECTDALVFCGAHRALRLPLSPFYQSRLRHMLRDTPYEPPRRNIPSLPPLIQFE